MSERFDATICILGFGRVGQQLTAALLGRVREILVYTRGSRPAWSAALGDLDTATVIDAGGTVLRRIDDISEVPPDALVVQAAKEGYSYKDYPPANLRLAGLKFDAPLIRRLSEQLAGSGFRGRYINVSNPSNVMARYSQQFLGLPVDHVIAFGSTLDCGRWAQQILADSTTGARRIDAGDVDCPIVGEHGPSMVFAESAVRLHGEPARAAIHTALRDAARRALADGPRIGCLQGGTWFAPARGLLRTIRFLLSDDHPQTCEGVHFQGHYVGVPVSKRAGRVTVHLEMLSPSERAAFEESLAHIDELYATVLRHFDSTKQRRDILVLDDEPGLARSIARLLQFELQDDPDLAGSFRAFLGHADSPAALLGDQDLSTALGRVCVGERLVDGTPPDQPIVGGPDLLVFDQLLGGGLKGLDCARRVKEAYQNARVVIYTGHSRLDDLSDMANQEITTRSGRRVKVVDAVILKGEHGDRALVSAVKRLLTETQYRTA